MVPGPAPGSAPSPPLLASTGIQGNFFASFKEDLQQFLFLRFTESDEGMARARLTELVLPIATTDRVATFNVQLSGTLHASGSDSATLEVV